ncbi:MAG: hypothetical protein IJ479_03410 [Alphaproteobacteria bacterium]|nr:hypothetical protein [Alphaproteobacteria bacterium]
MIYLYFALFIAVSALLWRIRGGLWKEHIPVNKIWYAVFFALCGYFHFGNIQAAVIGFICCYTSYQLYGWGLYVGRCLSGGALNPNLVQYRECELIDDLLYPLHVTFKGKQYYLYQYPRLFGFCGTTLTGLIITFLWGLYFGSIAVMLSGLSMGVCYWLGYLLNKLIPEQKAGWGYGEYIFGAYLGGWLAWVLLC